MLGVDAIREELATIRARCTGPVNVNFFCHRRPEPSAERERRWQEMLSPYFAEHGIDISAIPAGPGRLPFSGEVADVLEEFRPAVVSFHFGLPSADLLARVRSWGARILSSATTVDEARWLEARGVDAVIAQGLEAGGHRGLFLSDDLSTQMGTFALVPQIETVLAWLSVQPGSEFVRMSGSGASCFALFDSEKARDSAADRVPREWWRLATSLR